MQIVGIGTDIVECVRIRKMIEKHGEVFLKRVFTDREISYCQSCRQATEHFAGHWAAKEAVLKSLATNGQGGVRWTDIEVQNDTARRPQVLIRGSTKDLARRLGVTEILISIAHCRSYALAYATAVRRGAEDE